MYLVIGDLLDKHALGAVQEACAEMPFADGRTTAGRYAREVKANDQAVDSPELQAVLTRVGDALMSHPLFVTAARPRRLVRMLLSRYRTGQTYGSHVDDALMGGGRTDLSFTLFLSDPDSYDGGALIVQDTLEERAIKLAAGDLILYPSNTLHRVEPVTSGTRLAIVGWATSWIRSPEQREILFDLEHCLTDLHATEGKTARFHRLAKSRTNLLRMWADG